MKKARKKIVGIFTVLVLLMALLSGTIGAEPQHAISRIWGANRYQTAVAVSAAQFDSSEHVVIARGDNAGNFADALTASVLAGVLECPILLTPPTHVPEYVTDEILRLGAAKAYILGGTAAVSEDVAAELIKQGLAVERISGNNRYETAIAVAQYAQGLGGVSSTSFIVNGVSTADALVSGAFAYKNKVPIILVKPDEVPPGTMDALKALGIEEGIIVGGTGVVGASVAEELEKGLDEVTRLGGTNRYETSVLFARHLFACSEDVTFVRGDNANLVDGISAAALGLPIVYVRHTHLTEPVPAYLEEVLTGFSRIFAVGGPDAISESLLAMVDDMINGISPMTTRAYIEDEANNTKIWAEIDNTNNRIHFGIPADHQFTTGDANLSKPVFVIVSDTRDGAFDLPHPGIRVHPEDDFIDIILMLFEDKGEPGVSSSTLLANSGTKITLINVDDPDNSRTYTLEVVLLPG